MSILDLKSNLSNFRKPTTVKEQEKQKLKESPVIKTVYSATNELKNTSDIKINKVDNSTSIQVLGAKKIDYKLFSINTSRGRGIPAISTLFGKAILDKESLFKKFIPDNLVKVSGYKEQRPVSIPKESNFVKITPIGIQHISTFNAILTILKNKVSLYKEQFPRALPKISEYIDQSPRALLKLSLYIDQMPRPLSKLSLYIDQIPRPLLKLSLYKDQRPNMLAKISQYIQTLIDNKNSIYDTRKEILGFKYVSDRLRSLYLNQFPPIVNGFDDLKSGAKGFTIKQQTTQYLGIDIDSKTYTYPMTVKLGAILDRKRFYPVNDLLRIFDGKLAATKFERTYNTDKKPYTDKNSFLTNISNSLKSYAETRKSPSPLDIEYTKFNLKTASFNPFSFGPAFNQPLILRGIQREGKGGQAEEPQSWGFKNNFDDGLMRGGIVGSTERAIFDVLRIGKWMASPKGLLFIVKQAGLQAAAPNTEADRNVGGRAGNGALTLISSLANTATQHLGIRFRKDAFPFLPRTTYSTSLILNNSINDSGQFIGTSLWNPVSYLNPVGNRLLKLKDEYFNENPILRPERNGISKVLRGLGGPQSVYGIGVTNIRRTLVSNEYRIANNFGVSEVYNKNTNTRISPYSTLPYENMLDINTDEGFSAGGLTDLYNVLDDQSTFIDVQRPIINGVFNFKSSGKKLNGGYTKAKNSSNTLGINGNYYTLAYNDILDRAQTTELTSNTIYNFLLDGNGDPLNDDIKSAKWLSTNKDIQDYTETSQHKRPKLQIPNYGKRGKDLRNPLEGEFMEVYENDFGMTDPIWKVNQATKEEIDDFVKFIFHDVNTNEKFKFRAYIENVSENFNPEWQPVKILGRADSPYIYQGFERNVQISFKVAALSRGDLMLMWDQLERLARTTIPKYSNTYKMVGPLIKFTLGNWFQDTPAYIKSLGYTVDNETTWEINLEESDLYGENANENNVGQLPMLVSVQVDLQIFGDVRPEGINTDANTGGYYNTGNLYPLGSAGLRGKRQAKL